MDGEWISVGERLPDIGVTVLGWDRDGYHTLHTYMGKNKSGYDVWFGCNVAGGEYEDASSVSEPGFWMPLPAPPTDAKMKPKPEPVAWWLRGAEYDTGCEYEYVSLVKEAADEAAAEGGTVTPLYRSPTLTDEEREAVAAAEAYMSAAGCRNTNVQKTLRGLLERLK